MRVRNNMSGLLSAHINRQTRDALDQLDEETIDDLDNSTGRLFLYDGQIVSLPAEQ